MPESTVLPELKQIIGAMVFGADRALTAREVRKCLQSVANEYGKETEAFGKVRESDIRETIEELAEELRSRKLGFQMMEVAGGFRLRSDVACGKWLKQLLQIGKPNRLSRPALETLSIVAYRQPVSRVDIEAVRGVNVDHIVRALMELQLVRIVGRSELPGKPFLYGTTHTFLEHFGLKDLDELKSMHPALAMARVKEEQGPVAREAGGVDAQVLDEAEFDYGEDEADDVDDIEEDE